MLRPPAILAAACRVLAIGLTLIFALAPASRWGYFVYPAGLLCWLWLSGHGQAAPSASPAAGNDVRGPATMVR